MVDKPKAVKWVLLLISTNALGTDIDRLVSKNTQQTCATGHESCVTCTHDAAYHRTPVKLLPGRGLHAFSIRNMIQDLTGDGLVHAREALRRQAPVVPGHPPEVVHVVGFQERQVRLADGNVLGRRVLVQLLVPLLDEAVLDTLPQQTLSLRGCPECTHYGGLCCATG